METIKTIQILRFVAAAMVVAAHSWMTSFPLGAAGVDIFFVISGFIITKVMKGRHPSEFMLGRFVRIYPVYWIVTAPLLIVAVSQPTVELDRLTSSLTLWPIYNDFARPYLGVAWTLCFEMLFYTAAALVLWRERLLPWLVIGYLVAFGGALMGGSALLTFIGSPLIIEFGFGAAIASRNLTENRYGGAIALIVGLLALASQVGVVPQPEPSAANVFSVSPARVILWGVPAALIVWGALQFESLAKGSLIQTLSYLGGASYALYLIHPYSSAILSSFGTPVRIFLFSLVAGVLLHQFVERPVLRLTRLRLSGSRFITPVTAVSKL